MTGAALATIIFGSREALIDSVRRYFRQAGCSRTIDAILDAWGRRPARTSACLGGPVPENLR